MKSSEISKLLNLLKKKYPSPRTALRFNTPLELLVATILSAQCTDSRVNEVTEDLFKKYRKPEDYAEAKPSVFEEEIKPTGFYKNKARMILQCARVMVDNFKGGVPSTMEELTTLPGVGRKTASVILGSAFNIPAIAVDTHVLRVSNRVGLVNSRNPEKIEMTLRELIPEDKWIFFTLSTILHGRETCKARSPKCGSCILYNICNWGEKDNYK